MKQFIIICVLFFSAISYGVGQSEESKPFEDIIMFRPLGFVSFFDSGIEVDWYHHTNKNFFTVLGYKLGSSKLDLGLDFYPNWMSHSVHGALYFSHSLTDNNTILYTLGPKVEYSYRKHGKRYSIPKNNGEYWEEGTTVLHSNTVKFVFSEELIFLPNSRMVFSLGFDIGLSIRKAVSETPNAINRDLFTIDLGYINEGMHYLPHGRCRFGLGVRI